MSQKFLCFKGKHNEIDILHRPDFYDAMLLNKLPKNSSYQRLPLINHTPLSLHYYPENSKKKVEYLIHNNHLTISHQEIDGMAFIYSILIKEGNKISYITDSTRRKKRLTTKN